jgi:PTS system nitrogen regulatory IIA component
MQLGVKDAARLLEVSEKTVYRWVEEGKLPSCRINEQYRFNRAELLEWATARRMKVSPDIYKEVDGGEEAGLLSLSDALSEGGLHGPFAAGTKSEALKAAVERLPLPEDADRGFLLEMMLSREQLGSTGVGEGVAIPHARSPVVARVERPLAALCYLDPPVDFGAPDGRPVHALFAIVSTTIRSHLHLLSRLAFALREDSFKALLEKRAPLEALLAEVRRVEAGLGKGGR